MNIDGNISECLTPCIVKSKYFSKETGMDDSSSDFQEKKNYKPGPKNVQKAKVSKPRKPLKKPKRQRDIRTLIKNKNSELVSYSKDFDQVCKKSGVDVDSEQLQLAIALSKSLQESETRPVDSTQESKPLTTQERTAKIRTTLQEYGFRVPNTKISKDINKRRKFKKQYKLLLASDEEKQQIIADKYAEVLAKNIHKSPLKNSISLNSYNDQDIIYKATNVLYELIRNDDLFYVQNLFEKPLQKSYSLKDWSTIPGRPVSPKREQKDFNFDNIECTQDELDVILSGSILAAQSIIESKHVANSCNIDICNVNSPLETVHAENITISINNELNILNSTSSDNTKEIINSETMNFLDTMSTVTQKVRSASPDIFDDDISLTLDHTTNSTSILKENLNQSKKNVTEFMDITECVNIAPERDKPFKNRTLSLKKTNVSNKSKDFMEMTECVPSTAKQCFVENIDLTQGFGYSKRENCSNNVRENLEVDLTQSSNSDVDSPEEIDNVTPQQVLNQETLDQKQSLEFENDYETRSNKNEQENIHIEITKTISTDAKDSHMENIDLTQSFNHSKIHETDKLEMDLTQSSNSNVDLPEESLDARQEENLLEGTVLNDRGLEVFTNELTNKEKLSSPINSEYVNDNDIEDYIEEDNTKNPTNNVKHKDNSNTHLYEYYTAKKFGKNITKGNFETTKSLPVSPKESIIDSLGSIIDSLGLKNIDQTQGFHSLKEVNSSTSIYKTNVTKRISNDFMEITECVPTTAEQNIIDNIDLTQNFNYTKGENLTNNLTENMLIDLTQPLHSNKKFQEAKIVDANNKIDNSLDDTIVIIGESEFNSDPEIKEPSEKSLISQNNLEFANVDGHIITDDNFKPKISDKYCINHSLSKISSDYEDNISYSEEHCNDIDSNKENERNLEIDLTQTSDPIGPITEIADTENKDLLDDTVLITDEVNCNSTLDELKDSELKCNDYDKSKENEPDNDNLNNEPEYNSFVFDHYDAPSYIESPDKIISENVDSNNKSQSYTEHNRNSYNNSDKNSGNKSDLEELDNIDLTQNSHSSNEATEKQCYPTFDANLGKIDNISIDYDEMFDHIVSTGSKCASTSFKSTSNDSIKKADNSNNEASNHSKTSEFEISDKELNYSLHKSRHNFDIGGLSVLDNVSDFKMQSINGSSRQSKTNLNRSFSDSDIPSARVKRITVHTPKALSNSNNRICETSTPVINRCLIEEVQNTPKNGEYIIKTQNVTPMMDYEAMTSPERNRELEKYGLKPFKRKRAIQLLRHLYEQTHPVVESCDIEECSSPSKRRKYDNGTQYYKSPEKPKRSPRKSPKKTQRSPRNQEINLLDCDKENTLYIETKNTPDIKEVKCVPEDWVFQKREKAKVHSCKVPLHIAFHNYVSCRQLLREAILRYEPINIDVVHKDLVASGYKYNPKDLLRFLDKKCITVKTADNNSRNRKS